MEALLLLLLRVELHRVLLMLLVLVLELVLELVMSESNLDLLILTGQKGGCRGKQALLILVEVNVGDALLRLRVDVRHEEMGRERQWVSGRPIFPPACLSCP